MLQQRQGTTQHDDAANKPLPAHDQEGLYVKV
jgi:hypothetical protein